MAVTTAFLLLVASRRLPAVGMSSQQLVQGQPLQPATEQPQAAQAAQVPRRRKVHEDRMLAACEQVLYQAGLSHIIEEEVFGKFPHDSSCETKNGKFTSSARADGVVALKDSPNSKVGRLLLDERRGLCMCGLKRVTLAAKAGQGRAGRVGHAPLSVLLQTFSARMPPPYQPRQPPQVVELSCAENYHKSYNKTCEGERSFLLANGSKLRMKKQQHITTHINRFASICYNPHALKGSAAFEPEAACHLLVYLLTVKYKPGALFTYVLPYLAHLKQAG